LGTDIFFLRIVDHHVSHPQRNTKQIHWSKKGEVNYKSQSGSFYGNGEREIVDQKILEFSPYWF
jgi:hypothetical protein